MAKPIIKKLKTILFYNILALGVALPASLASVAAAPAASFSMTPNSGSFNVGDYLTVEVREDSGSVGVNFANPKVVYDKSVLQFQSVDTSQSPFVSPVGPTPTPDGLVDLPRGIVGTTIKTDQNIAFITFKITGAASASSLSFDSTSSIRSAVADPSSPSGVSTSEEWNGVTAGASFTLKALPVPPAPSGGGSGGGGSTSSGGTTTKKATVAGASTKPPTTKTLAPAPSTSTSTPSDDPGDDSALVPSTHMVSIKIVNTKGKPVVGAEVKLDKQTTHTLSDGTAAFVDIPDGTYTVSVTYNGKTTSQSITINAEGQPGSSVQNFKVAVAASNSIPTWLVYTGGAVLALFVLGFLIPRRHHGFGDFITMPIATESVVTGNMKNKPQVIAPAPPAQPVQPPQPVQPQPVTSQPPPPTPGVPAKPATPGSVYEPNSNNKDQT
jgi:hypothetical protein